MEIDTNNLDAFTTAYIECLLWQATDDNGEPLDMYSVDDIDPEGIKEIVESCADFQESNANMLSEAGDDSQNGHDFCLTRNGHGAGFWDRGYGKLGYDLSEASRQYGTLDVMLCEDSEVIYVHG